MDEMLSAIQPAVMNLVAVCITCLFGYVGIKVKQLYTEYVNTETKKKVVDSTVNYVEQVFTDIHGADKLKEAKTKVLTILNEKGISISDEELETLIESAVYGLNKGYNELIVATDEIAEDDTNVDNVG